MKVLLTTLNAKYIHINLAIRWLYDLNKDKVDLAWKEFTIKEDPQAIAMFCAQFDVVAFSCYIWNITPTLNVAKAIKLINPNTKILLGGPEVSYEFNEVISQPAVDFIIIGEGETPFAAFLEQYPNVAAVPSLVYKSEGEKIIQNASANIFDLKNYENKNPYIYDQAADLRSKVAYVETSRGCPYKCEFCLASLDNKVRYLPPETTKNTLLYLMEHGRVIKFLDRTFNAKKNFTLEMFQFILENYREGNIFQFEITADILHPDIIAFIKEKVPKGLFRFEIGIQTVNQKANLAVSRKQNFDKTKEVILQLQDKVEMHLDLIVGLPFDFWEDIKYSIEEVFKLFPPELQLGFLKFLKGTPVREKYTEHGFEFDALPPYQIIISNFLSVHELSQITLLENALEIFWNKKRTTNTLKYVSLHYSVFDFFVGLGNLFYARKADEQYGLKDVFRIIQEYAMQQFPDDNILQQFIVIDYYLQYKVKPQPIFELEFPAKERNQIISQYQLNHHDFRFVCLPISFDFEYFYQHQIIQKTPKLLVIQYSGTELPTFFTLENS